MSRPLRALTALLLAALLAASAASVSQPASAHRDPCHPSHSCPSDHHSYPWNGLWCTSYPDERLASDTKVVVSAGRSYWCHGSQASAKGSASSGGGSSACGKERWSVKTLQDRPTLKPVKETTLAFLVSRPEPASLPDTRLPFERSVFRVHAAVTLVRKEKDSDLHLVLRDGANQMIAEAPSPSCTAKASALRRTQMTQARAAVRVCSQAVVTGVAFFDFKHNQIGLAPNAIELHPILAFRCLAS